MRLDSVSRNNTIGNVIFRFDQTGKRKKLITNYNFIVTAQLKTYSPLLIVIQSLRVADASFDGGEQQTDELASGRSQPRSPMTTCWKTDSGLAGLSVTRGRQVLVTCWGANKIQVCNDIVL